MLIVLFLIGFIVGRLDFQWLYEISSTWYYDLKSWSMSRSIDNPLIILTFLIWLLVLIIDMYKMLKKVFSYIDDLSEASIKLLDKNTDIIELPSELEEIEKRLNKIKLESERNAALAEESERRKNDLIVYLAHDLKTPLTSMIGYLSLIDEIKDMPEEKREKYVSIALNKSYKLESLINELFDISRFNAESIVLETTDINLNLMFEQIIDDFYPILKEHHKMIKFNAHENISIEGDSERLYRVFNNLLKNAINYSTEETITIDLKREDHDVEIVVSNKSKKIPKEKLDRLFEKFYRLDESRSTASGGSGLGLAIAKEIVELHGGKIEAMSDEATTSFIVHLPL